MKKLSQFLDNLRVKSANRTKRALTTSLVCISLTCPLLANPSGPTVRHGQVNITAGSQTQIQQLTQKAIVDWNSFSIGAQESVRFLQPNELSVILNRVTGGDPSEILGQLSANGNVFLINPNGILFGPGSVVNVGGLVASTLNISNEDFLAGNYSFSRNGDLDLGAVVNQGTIRIADGGYAVLTGPGVINEGVILAKAGSVTLAAGEQTTLNLDGRDLIHFATAGAPGEGTILLAPGMMSTSIAQTLGVDHRDLASEMVRLPDGSVRLASAGTLVQAGVVSADGTTDVDAGDVALESTELTILTGSSTTSASGIGDSNAGSVVALSDMQSGTTIVESGALIGASAESGDAGFVETSAEVVQMAGTVDLYADGAAGAFLLDPTTVRIVDETFAGVPPAGESFTTDASLETILDSGALAQVQSDEAIILDVTTTSGGTDTGIQSTGVGNLSLDTLTLGGTDVILQSDQIMLAGGLSIDTQGGVQLGTSAISVDQFLSINSTGDVDLGSSQITANQGATIIADPGEITGDGFRIDTRQDPTNFGDGGTLGILAAGDISLSNGTLQFARPFSTGGLNIDTDGDVILTNMDLQSESEIVAFGAGTRTDFKAEARISSNLNSVSLINTDLTGDVITLTANTTGMSIGVDDQSTLDSSNTISLTGGDLMLDGSTMDAFNSITMFGEEVMINDADISVSVRSRGAVVPFTPLIDINATGNIDGDSTAANGLKGARILLDSDGDIEVAIDTSSDGDDPTVPFTSIPTRLTAEAINGNITIRDIATSNALGFDLSRPNGLGFGMPADTQAVVALNDITLTSQGKIGFGLGDGTVRDEGFAGAPILHSTGGGSVTISAVGALLDQHEIVGTAFVDREIDAQTGTVSLTSNTGIGSFTDPDFTGILEVEAGNIIINAAGPNTPVNVGGTNYASVDATIDGGQLRISDATGNLQVTPNGPLPDILDIAVGFGPTAIRLETAEDLAIRNSTLAASQTLVITTTNGGRILNEDPSGTGLPSITTGNTSALVLNADGDIGTATDPFRADSPDIFIQGNTANVFLEVGLPTAIAGPVNIQGADPGFFSQPVASLPTAPVNTPLNIAGNLVIKSTDDLALQSDITSTNGVAVESTADVTINGNITGDAGIVLIANTLNGATNRLNGGVIGLAVGTDLGTAIAPIEILDADGIVLGNDPARSYFLREDGTTDTSLLDSVTVGGVTVTGNQVATLELQKSLGNLNIDAALTASQELKFAAPDTTAGNINVNQSVTSANRAEILAAGDIGQGASGVVNADALILDAGGNIGGATNDQLINANTLAVGSGGNAYVRDGSGDLEIVTDVALTQNVGAQNDLRVRVDNGDLLLSTDLAATDVALVAGPNLQISAQTTAQDIILNGNVDAIDNLVLIAVGDIVMNSGNLTAINLGLGAGGNIGSVGNPISVDVVGLALNKSAILQTTNTPTDVPSVTAAGATVNGPATITPPIVNAPDPTTEFNPIIDGPIGPDLAQDNVGLVEENLFDLIGPDGALENILDPTTIPLDWFNDEEILRRKRRR